MKTGSYFLFSSSHYYTTFHSIINFGGWISGLLSRVLLSGGVCPALVSLINIHKPCLSVYVQTSEILYIRVGPFFKAYLAHLLF